MSQHWFSQHWHARHWSSGHWSGFGIAATADPDLANDLLGSDSTPADVQGAGGPADLLGSNSTPAVLEGFDSSPVDLLGDSRETEVEGT